MRPVRGGSVGFRGDELLHGGDPLVRGRRYVLVGFCHVCTGRRQRRKRRKRRSEKEIDRETTDSGFVKSSMAVICETKKVRLESIFQRDKERKEPKNSPSDSRFSLLMLLRVRNDN